MHAFVYWKIGSSADLFCLSHASLTVLSTFLALPAAASYSLPSLIFPDNNSSGKLRTICVTWPGFAV